METRFVAILITVCAIAGCEAGYHARQVDRADSGNGLTVGTVQKEISKGMSSADVAEKLGSPNIVSTDDQGREVWIYDRTATDVVASGSSWFVTAGAASKSQRTLTIIIKYDESARVRDIAYHSSSF
jgi:outer membrane protein assembly factor BamE (lipoprotein component of BamABCDE complex)